MHDFAAGSTDELSFHAGDRIAVINEVLDGWWMGELGGKRGLFPTTYVEVLPSSLHPSAPALPQRPPAMTRGVGASAPPVLTTDTRRGRHKEGSTDERDYDVSSSDDEHPFGDHHFADSLSPVHGQFDSGGGLSGEEDDEERLVPARKSSDSDNDRVHRPPAERLVPPRRPMEQSLSAPAARKPAPPPPPPRRSTTTSGSAPTPPPIPSRPSLHTKTSQSSSSSFATMASTPTMTPQDLDGLTNSPFDSPGDAW
ncbi:hypothetical protein IEO21_03750 [Rhodonia placenta]|uniref:SH3 domain-containing protein n=1 Tax=Rhodonia placenta TaxID=104341 RepID=A0A8H7P562_9APHY|nr:hypothetical protein IEO21_03750 [Postia placenta]